MLDVIICANFGVEKLRGLGSTRGQILEFPIEMAGHLYNRAGATAQPVIKCLSFQDPQISLKFDLNSFRLRLVIFANLGFGSLSGFWGEVEIKINLKKKEKGEKNKAET